MGQGVVGIPTIIEELKRIGFDGPTTLEVAGEDNVRASIKKDYLDLATREDATTEDLKTVITGAFPVPDLLSQGQKAL